MGLMKRINLLVIILSLLVSLFMYPETYIFCGRLIQDASAQQKLSRFISGINTVPKNDPNKTNVVFLFDDGWKSVYTQAYPIFKEFQFRGNIAVIPSLTGDKDYMSLSEIAEMYMQGWDIMNHTFSHKENMYFDSKDLLVDFNKARDWMNKRHLSKCSSMAVIPYGDANPYFIQLMQSEKYQNIRTSDNVIIINTDKICYFPVKTINLLTDAEPKEVAEVLCKPQNEGNTVIFILHKISDLRDNYGMTYPAGKLKEILQFIKDHQEKFQVVTYSNIIPDCI